MGFQAQVTVLVAVAAAAAAVMAAAASKKISTVWTTSLEPSGNHPAVIVPHLNSKGIC